MIRVVTIIGHGVSTYGANFLPHFLEHYKFADEIDIVIYVSDKSPDIESEIRGQIRKHKKVKIVKVYEGRVFDWNKVTDLYNEVKYEHPNDWWIVADIDEFHIYPGGDPKFVIKECERNGWELVRGGFIDRLGNNGRFSILEPDKNIFDQFPMMGFFRYPLSKACPNKVCIMKGNIEITSGQHYAKIDGHTTWRWQGWNHPLIAPYEEYSVQVHHFKWDSTCLERMMDVIRVNKDYSFSDEYRIMYNALKENNFIINLQNEEFMFEESKRGEPRFGNYIQWNKLIKKIISI